MLEHGGALRAAANRYGIPLPRWLDLSTGINPRGWLPPPLPAEVWRRLPELDDGLEKAAADYYGSDRLLAIAGSQAAIQALPVARERISRVGVLSPSYGEHGYAWRRQGHQVQSLPCEALDEAIPDLDVLVLVNPNNPTGVRFELDTLLDWRARLAAKGGWLIVDEAFMDPTPEQSLAQHVDLPGLIVLCSLGKFFGLAGMRVGFVLGETNLLERLREHLGPWTVNGPARWVATQALADREWHQTTRDMLNRESRRLADLLRRHGLAPAGGTALFQWRLQNDAVFFQDVLAKQGILVRRFSDPPGLRLGLPDGEAAWRRLDLALTGARAQRLAQFDAER